MDRPPDVQLNNDTTRELCQRSNSRAMLTGSIDSVGSHYLIGLRAIDCLAGDTLAGAKAEAINRDDVLKRLGDAGNGLREKLGESLASVQRYNKPLEQATTSSQLVLDFDFDGWLVFPQQNNAFGVCGIRNRRSPNHRIAPEYAVAAVAARSPDD